MVNKIIYGLTCDYAFLDEKKKHNYIGVFDNITVSADNGYKHSNFFLGFRYKTDKLKHNLAVKLRPPVGENQTQEDIEIGNGPVELKGKPEGSFIVRVVNFNFDKPGTWKVLASIDGGENIELTSIEIKHNK